MKKFLKWTAYAVIILVLIAIAGISYITLALPNVGQPEAIKVDATPQRIARGKYLANNVTVCLDCHSTRVGINSRALQILQFPVPAVKNLMLQQVSPARFIRLILLL